MASVEPSAVGELTERTKVKLNPKILFVFIIGF